MGTIDETLGKLATDASPAVRGAATTAMDRIAARRSAERFREILAGGTLDDRIRVVHAASEMGGAEGTALLVSALSDESAEVRGAAVLALSDNPAVPILKALHDRMPLESGAVLGDILEAMGKSRRKELAPVVERYLDDEDPFVQGKALVAFGRLCGTDGAGKIAARGEAPSETVRAAVAAALGELPLS